MSYLESGGAAAPPSSNLGTGTAQLIAWYKADQYRGAGVALPSDAAALTPTSLAGAPDYWVDLTGNGYRLLPQSIISTSGAAGATYPTFRLKGSGAGYAQMSGVQSNDSAVTGTYTIPYFKISRASGVNVWGGSVGSANGLGGWDGTHLLNGWMVAFIWRDYSNFSNAGVDRLIGSSIASDFEDSIYDGPASNVLAQWRSDRVGAFYPYSDSYPHNAQGPSGTVLESVLLTAQKFGGDPFEGRLSQYINGTLSPNSTAATRVWSMAADCVGMNKDGSGQWSGLFKASLYEILIYDNIGVGSDIPNINTYLEKRRSGLI